MTTHTYAVTGATGQVGSILVEKLLKAGQKVHAVVRDSAKAQLIGEQGADTFVASLHNAEELIEAFAGAEGVFLMLPPSIGLSDDYKEHGLRIAAYKEALLTTRPKIVVFLSTVGADAVSPSMLSVFGKYEQALVSTGLRTVFLRPGYFMENTRWYAGQAQNTGKFNSFFDDTNAKIPMVSVRDVAHTACDLLLNSRASGQDQSIVELECIHRYSMQDTADIFEQVLGRPVVPTVIPREDRAVVLQDQGIKHTEPILQMYDGYNEGWIRFSRDDRRKGTERLEEVIAKVIGNSAL